MKYFGEKQLENVTTEELRDFLLKYLKEEKKLSDRSVNYYNSVIRFVWEVTYVKKYLTEMWDTFIFLLKNSIRI